MKHFLSTSTKKKYIYSTETFNNHFAKKKVNWKVQMSTSWAYLLKKKYIYVHGTILHQDLEEQEKHVFGHSQKVSVFHICGKNPLFATIFGVIIRKSWRFLKYLDIFPHGQ